MVDTNSLFADRDNAYGTVESCQDYCASQPDCVAIDFNTLESSCWVHRNAANLQETFYQDGTNQYRIDRECATGTTTTGTTSSTAGLLIYYRLRAFIHHEGSTDKIQYRAEVHDIKTCLTPRRISDTSNISLRKT